MTLLDLDGIRASVVMTDMTLGSGWAMDEGDDRHASQTAMAERFPMLAELERFVARLEGASRIEQARVVTRMQEWLNDSKPSPPSRSDRSYVPGMGEVLARQSRSWSDEKNPFAEQVREELVRHFGASGGRSSISSALKHLHAQGALKVDRSQLTQTLNRMCRESKTTRKTLLRSVKQARGEFELHDDGHAMYQLLVGGNADH